MRRAKSNDYERVVSLVSHTKWGAKSKRLKTSIEMKLPSNKRVTIIAQKDIQLVLRFDFAPAIFKQDNHIFLPIHTRKLSE